MKFELREKLYRLAYIDEDKKYLCNNGFTECCSFINSMNGCYTAKGTLRSDRLEKEYKVVIHYPEKYPYKPPIIAPLNQEIKNNYHQDPSIDCRPGKLCLYNFSNVNEWSVGTSASEIFDKLTDWFKKYEDKSLNEELAPPELYRYYPLKQQNLIVNIIIVEDLMDDLKPLGDGKLLWTKGKELIFIDHKDITCLSKYEEILYEVDNQYKPINVPCYEVSTEPLPVLTSVKELYHFIINNKTDKSINKETIAQRMGFSLFVALKYAFNSIDQWAFFEYSITYPEIIGKLPKGFRSYSSAINAVGNSDVKLYSKTSIISYEAIFKRNSNAFSKVVGKKVLILGIGTIGSKIAELLVKSGIKSIAFIDNDTIEAGNVCRHILTLESLNKYKVEEMAKHLLKINPFLEIEPINGNLMRRSILNEKYYSKFDLVISCLGDNCCEEYVGSLACKSKTQTIFVRSYVYSTIGEIILYNGANACFKCTKQFVSSEANCITPKIPVLSFTEAYKYDYDCGSPFIPAATVDIEYISLMATQIVFRLLSGEKIHEDYYLTFGRRSDENKEHIAAFSGFDQYSMKAYILKGVAGRCDVCG